MPEGPEVENVRLFLEHALLKPKPKKIKTLRIFYPGIIKGIDPGEFSRSLIGQSFRAISRYGKYLILQLTDWSIISHLRMEGQYILWDKKYQPEKHDHLDFTLGDGSHLVYNDVRKFGTMSLVRRGEEFSHPSLQKLGPEITDEDNFTVRYLSDVCQKTTKNIKSLILDQGKICGAGNIYTDEILFASKVHPLRMCKSLDHKEIESIVDNSRKIIKEATLNRGTTFRSFTVNHESGSYQDNLKVFNKGG